MPSATAASPSIQISTPLAAANPHSPSATRESTCRSKQTESTTPSLFDPTHIPTFNQRIIHICQLLQQSSRSPNSLSTTITQPDSDSDPTSNQQTQSNTTTTTTTLNSTSGPNVALGSTTEDDVGLWQFDSNLLSKGPKSNPTQLTKDLVAHSQALQDAFDRARKAIQALPGGEMDIEEQERLIQSLKQYQSGWR